MRQRAELGGGDLLGELSRVATAIVGLAIIATLTRRETETEVPRPADEDAAAEAWARRALAQGADPAFIQETAHRSRASSRAKIIAIAKERLKEERRTSAKQRAAANKVLKAAAKRRAARSRERAPARRAQVPRPSARGRGGALGDWMLRPGGDLIPAREPLHVRDVIEAILEAREASE